MFSKIFGKPKEQTNALATLDKLNETLEMLEKKEKVLLKKAAAEVERAKEFTRAKNKRAAIQCLKRKRLYEQQIEQLGNFQLRIHDQMIMLEGAKATTETVDALRTGAAAMKAMQKATNIDDVDKTMDEINEQTENMKQIQEALSAPIGIAADFDEVLLMNWKQNLKSWREQSWRNSFSNQLRLLQLLQYMCQLASNRLGPLLRKLLQLQRKRTNSRRYKQKWQCRQDFDAQVRPNNVKIIGDTSIWCSDLYIDQVEYMCVCVCTS
ncbi:Vacuolar protein sorting-associated protein 1 [Ananas comosus]|uniref:Vacuolar protein sorting-associated protein 1 n=2 Tax=Ananas comosus TaxID=4615 RepID=A0A199VGK6_ANACO|nr:Vacuolar protein sorting-associated protein 1 [Ananas comosus]